MHEYGNWVKEILKGYGVKNPIVRNIEVDENDFGNIEDVFTRKISNLKKEGSIANVSMLADFIFVKSTELSPSGFGTEGNDSKGMICFDLLT